MKISGFISYSHADGADYTDDIDKYLTDLLSNFQPIYDKDVPEGERVEKFKELLSFCKILILIITPAALISPPIKEEISIAKKNGMKIIPFKSIYVRESWENLPWDIKDFKGFTFENISDLRRKAVYSISKLLDELEEEQVEELKIPEELPELKLPGGSSNLMLVMSDKNVYQYGSDMIITIINPNSASIEPINLKIFNEDKKLVYKNSIPINENGEVTYQEVVLIDGEEWKQKPGSEYLVVAEHEGTSAKLNFYLADFGMVIELDQKIYTWTDKVYITIIAPDLVRVPTKIETIGSKPESSLTISTRKGTLTNYELLETGKGTGIFTGEVCLTGFSYDAKGDKKIDTHLGKSTGTGPTDGLIASGNDDGIKVTFTTPNNSVSGSALVRWNIGEVQWTRNSYKIGDTGTFVVIDPDMNLNPNLIDMFKIRVWSDSDPIGIELLVIETGNATGIFAGDIQFGNITNQSQIKVSPGDSVMAEYVDRTLPEPNSVGDETKISGTTSIQ